ncbi:hypothetical protein ISCGN_001492 [Ixodes scapularis]
MRVSNPFVFIVQLLLGFSASSAPRGTFYIFPEPDATHHPSPAIIASDWAISPTAPVIQDSAMDGNFIGLGTDVTMRVSNPFVCIVQDWHYCALGGRRRCWETKLVRCLGLRTVRVHERILFGRRLLSLWRLVRDTLYGVMYRFWLRFRDNGSAHSAFTEKSFVTNKGSSGTVPSRHGALPQNEDDRSHGIQGTQGVVTRELARCFIRRLKTSLPGFGPEGNDQPKLRGRAQIANGKKKAGAGENSRPDARAPFVSSPYRRKPAIPGVG